MSRDMSLLNPEFRASVEEVLGACRALGIEMRPYETLRDPWTQARFWRQSRSIEEIESAIRNLEQKGAPFLAQVIRSVGPQFGDRVTDALPGTSWHQWGEALDCFWLLDEKAEWSTLKKVRLADGREMNGYRLYGEEAVKRGLTSGGLWPQLKDWVHLQQRSGSVLNRFSWPEIDREMRQRFAVVEGTTGIAVPPVVEVTAAPEAPPDEFVQPVGDQFHVNGEPFKFVGFNLRGVVHYGAQFPGDDTFIVKNTRPEHRAQQTRRAYEMGARVIRVFLPHRNATPQQVGDRLEDLLRIIKGDLGLHDLYLLPALTDFLGYGEVPFKVQGDQDFYQPIGNHITLTPEFFRLGFTQNYLPFVRYIVDRFKDEPQIFAWEIANEAKVNDNPRMLTDFKHHVAREIRALDARHMITTGMVSTAHAFMFSGDQLRRDLYGKREQGRRLIDFVTVHYPDESHPTGPNHGDIDLAQELNMPSIVEEFMVISPEKTRDRTGDFKAQLDQWFGKGAGGCMVWGFDALHIGDGDDAGGIGHPFTDFNNLVNMFRAYGNQL